MIRYLRYAFLAAVALVLLTVALANRQVVSLRLLPPEIAELIGLDLGAEIPLFFVAFGGVVAGILIGFVWEWFREHKHRAEMTKRQKQVKDLRREVIKLKGEKNEGQDDVLALLEEAPRRKAG